MIWKWYDSIYKGQSLYQKLLSVKFNKKIYRKGEAICSAVFINWISNAQGTKYTLRRIRLVSVYQRRRGFHNFYVFFVCISYLFKQCTGRSCNTVHTTILLLLCLPLSNQICITLDASLLPLALYIHWLGSTIQKSSCKERATTRLPRLFILLNCIPWIYFVRFPCTLWSLWIKVRWSNNFLGIKHDTRYYIHLIQEYISCVWIMYESETRFSVVATLT